MSFYQQTGAAVSGADHRRKWDANEFQAKANERLAEEKAAAEAKKNKEKPKGPKPRRELLQARDEKVDLESKVGKQVTINKATATEESGGFYCEICECSLKDSINYLDHINGKNHQHKFGYSMKVKRSTLDDVVATKEIERILAGYKMPRKKYAVDTSHRGFVAERREAAKGMGVDDRWVLAELLSRLGAKAARVKEHRKRSEKAKARALAKEAAKRESGMKESKGKKAGGVVSGVKEAITKKKQKKRKSSAARKRDQRERKKDFKDLF